MVMGGDEEQIYVGLGVSPGIAIGVVHLHDRHDDTPVPHYRLSKDAIPFERQRFADAVSSTAHQIAKLQNRARDLPGASGEELGYMLEAYRQMLDNSRLTRGVDRRIGEERLNAEAALQQEIAEIVAHFEGIGDSYLAARVDDIRDIGRRLIRNLGTSTAMPLGQIGKNAVVLAEELSPADTALFDPALVAGFATILGGPASHTAIMARSLGLPAVVGLSGLPASSQAGHTVIVDGSGSKVIVNPSAETLAEYRLKRADFLRARRRLHHLRKVPAITRDGTEISLEANLELPSEIGGVGNFGAAGIGLLRTEFIFMNRANLPSEEEQTAILSDLVTKLDGRVLTVRTLDAGGDKTAPALGRFEGPNPALGLRAIRLSLKRPEILDTQLAAILRAGALGPVRILLPMVCTVAELLAVRRALEGVVHRLKRRKLPFALPLPPVGTMIEIPGAALAADALAQYSDFFAIGTNDLTQYTLAIDRTDEQVAHLYDPLHPAVLRLVQFATEAALRARIPVSVCGEIAGDPRYTALLLGLGIRELSMAAARIPAVKQRLRAIDLMEATRRARVIMDQSDSGRIAQLLDDFNAQAGI
jgi:phosphotransferase system enzyme I (PtsI)